MNPLLLTDSYKVTHWKQYPPGTEHVYSYFESRGGEHPEVMFFGLQYFLKKYLEGQFFTQDDFVEAAVMMSNHIGPSLFNVDGWTYILDKHKGRLPVEIKAVAEGTIVPNRNVLMTIENTDPKVPWLTNWLETLLVHVWYPTTVATLSRSIRQNIERELLETAGHVEGLDFKLHDFGFRGVSSVESAAIGGAAHLVNFQSTDTMAALKLLRDYYGADMPGHSIPAAEHSTITSWGKLHEYQAFQNMLEQFPSGLVAVVSDSFDIFSACRAWGRPPLRDLVIKRGEDGGTLVVRPDSGDPAETVLAVLGALGSGFPTRDNAMGFRVLPDCVRVIQADGVDPVTIREILRRMKVTRWSAENIAFGMGGALLQKLNRDTQQFAFKCSQVRGTYGDRDVYKDPATAISKKSKAGRLKLVRVSDGSFYTGPPETVGEDQLRTVFKNGQLTIPDDLDHIRARSRSSSLPR